MTDQAQLISVPKPPNVNLTINPPSQAPPQPQPTQQIPTVAEVAAYLQSTKKPRKKYTKRKKPNPPTQNIPAPTAGHDNNEESSEEEEELVHGAKGRQLTQDEVLKTKLDILLKHQKLRMFEKKTSALDWKGYSTKFGTFIAVASFCGLIIKSTVAAFKGKTPPKNTMAS